MNLATEKLSYHLPEIVAKTRVQVFGDVSRLPNKLRKLLEKATEESEHIQTPILNLCFSYTSTNEMTRATQHIVDACASGKNWLTLRTYDDQATLTLLI